MVIVDPVSLFAPLVANAFRDLLKVYLRQEESVLVSLSPVSVPGVDWFATALKEQSVPVLDDFFEPSIPPIGSFAKCAINVQRITDIERLIRSRLGSFYLAQSEIAVKSATSMVKK